MREALRQPNEVGRLRFEQFLRHLPSPNPSTFAWMRATLLRLAGGEATGGSIPEVVAEEFVWSLTCRSPLLSVQAIQLSTVPAQRSRSAAPILSARR